MCLGAGKEGGSAKDHKSDVVVKDPEIFFDLFFTFVVKIPLGSRVTHATFFGTPVSHYDQPPGRADWFLKQK